MFIIILLLVLATIGLHMCYFDAGMFQISCLRAEQTQLSRLLEKERQRASESRQEYLAAKEAAATHEGRAKQLEEELKELRSKHRNELQEEMERRGNVEQVTV